MVITVSTEITEMLNQADLIYDVNQINRALDGLASQLNTRFENEHPVVLCVMRGGVVFTGHMLTRLTFMLELDYVHVTRYRNQTKGDDLEWVSYSKLPLNNRTVLVLDDILDEGITLDAIVKNCYAQDAKNVITAVLLHKKHDRCKPGIKADYVAMDVEDRYVFGFGMDYKGEFRHLNGIYAVKDQ